MSTGKEANVYHAVANSSHAFCAGQPTVPAQLLQRPSPLVDDDDDDEAQLRGPRLESKMPGHGTQDLLTNKDDDSLLPQPLPAQVTALLAFVARCEARARTCVCRYLGLWVLIHSMFCTNGS